VEQINPGDVVHYTPMDDLIEHDPHGQECICGPRLQPFQMTSGGVFWQIIHFPLDGQQRSGVPPTPDVTLD
jgi:hypothetical protein